MQCHTNLVAVFSELEEEPELGKDLFSSTTSLGSLMGPAGAAEAGGDGTASGAEGAAPGGGAVDGGTGGAGSATPGGGLQGRPGQVQAADERREAADRGGEEPVRVVLLRRPQRRFVAPARRTPKLLGMVQVVCASSESALACGMCCFCIAACGWRGMRSALRLC